MQEIHPFYERHRPAMEADMLARLDFAEPLLLEQMPLLDVQMIRHDIMTEFSVVLTQVPFVGGDENRMSDFFMRLIGFMAIGRVLQRHGVPLAVIGHIERESYTAHLLTVPEAERMASGRQFMSEHNKALIREQAARSRAETYPGDFVYDFVEPGPGDTFEFGINYRACGFCRFAARHGDRDILSHICGLDFEAYAARGIHLDRTQTLASGASHCNFRFSRMTED
jgi:hypothetical protein